MLINCKGNLSEEKVMLGRGCGSNGDRAEAVRSELGRHDTR